ncbi:6-pyruvoyl trahydropterin synthase family protein [Thermococcus paralvinellae]|uniref:Putative 6-pyruvoyl-tetrahydropterin synthase n=1 Tax=Thermococcus paralvinellae TaxID=582419 RepID=W0I378_9EURY|nr:6-carboxytetrahydropterin synthase [Thermococcus paralvinellae]AHF80469.1 putative 6-pyruvoyl-tetrahydropterin synthase [Thermococcus paralvinellae]
MEFKVVERKIGWHKDFDSSHFLVLPYDSKCLRIHGHTYNVDVEIWGDLDERGMIFDFNHLSNLIKEVDHRILTSIKWIKEDGDYIIIVQNDKELKLPKNEVVLIDAPNVTAELIAEWFAKKIAEKAGNNVKRIKVKVWEDPRSYAEIILER